MSCSTYCPVDNVHYPCLDCNTCFTSGLVNYEQMSKEARIKLLDWVNGPEFYEEHPAVSPEDDLPF